MRTKYPIQLAKEHIILSAYSEAIALLRPEAERGHPDAQFLYGYLHFLNPDLSSFDALDLIRRAAQQGHAAAHYVLATIHDFNADYQFEMPRTEEEWAHLEIAVQQGSVAAVVQMAIAYRDGIYVQKDIRRARKLRDIPQLPRQTKLTEKPQAFDRFIAVNFVTCTNTCNFFRVRMSPAERT